MIEAIIRCDGGLEEILRGEDPLQVERLWQKMYAATGLFGRRGVTIAAIGAVETALWDIAGQALGRPVCELIWQACCTVTESSEIKERVRPYATVYPPGEDVGEIVERFTLARERNFRAMKLEEWPGGFSHVSIQRDVEVVRAARETIGEERDLLIDVQNRWSEVGQALESIRAIAEFSAVLCRGAAASGQPTRPGPAGGCRGHAHCRGRLGIHDPFRIRGDSWRKGAWTWCNRVRVRSGGIREITRIAEAAYRRGLICVPHAWCHMVGVAAEIHLAAVLPNMPYFEMPSAFPDSPIISELLEPVIKGGRGGSDRGAEAAGAGLRAE